MRPPLDTGEIGDGISLALHDGVIGEIGSVRKYDPVNPFDVSDMEDPPPVPALFLSSEAIPFISPFETFAYGVTLWPSYPMTFYQRTYQWPPVGPMYFDVERSVSLPPKEVPLGQTDWSLRPVSAVPIFDIYQEVPPDIDGQALDVETIIPQRGNRNRAVWTVRKTMPLAPTVFIRNVQLEGDTGRFVIAGVTRDSAGAALGSCRVVVMRSDRIAINQDIQANPIVADTMSDGSGNYSVQVGANVPHQLTAYKAGSPDVAGITRSDVRPTVV